MTTFVERRLDSSRQFSASQPSGQRGSHSQTDPPGLRRRSRGAGVRAQSSTRRCRPLNAGGRRTRSTVRSTRWHSTVRSSAPRNGLLLGAMSPTQQRRSRVLPVHQFAGRLPQGGRHHGRSSPCSSRMSTGLMDFDAVLYYVSVFGTPRAPARAWRFERHHLSRRFTIVGDPAPGAAVLPRRLADPGWKRVPPRVAKGARTMPREEAAACVFVLSLDQRIPQARSSSRPSR